MTKNTQEYINNLLNKHKTFYLDLSSPCQVSQCSHCNKKSWQETTPNLTGEIENLSEFQNLRGINASNNKFTRIDGLFTLHNKNKVEKINLFGNQIKEVDLTKVFSEFSNLKYLNLERNPLSIKNLSNLTSKQLNKLIEGIKSKSIRISFYQGTVYTDLLEYTQKLISKGENTPQAQQLKAVIQNSSVKNETQPDNSKNLLLVCGVVLVGLALVIGYLVGKRRKEY